QGAHGHGGQRDENERNRDAVDDDRPNDAADGDVEVDVSQGEVREREDQESRGDQKTVVEFTDQAADDGRHDESADAAWTQRQTGREGRIIHQVLQKKRQEGGRSVQNSADDRHENGSDREVAVFQDAKIDDGVREIQFPDNETDQSHQGDDHPITDPG